MLAALVLSLLGVDDDIIATDYGLSRLGMDRMVEWVRETYPDRYDTMADQPAAFLDAPEAAMTLFLADLRDRARLGRGLRRSRSASAPTSSRRCGRTCWPEGAEERRDQADHLRSRVTAATVGIGHVAGTPRQSGADRA